MVTSPSMFGQLKDLIAAGLFPLQGIGAPVNGTTGANIAANGCGYTDNVTGFNYVNVGTLASPVWNFVDGFTTTQQFSGTISAANITGTSAGQLGHANGVILVPAQGTHVVVELISVVLLYKFGTAAYTGGGNVTVNNGGGGSALTGLVSAANSIGKASSNGNFFVPLSTVGIALVENGPINLVAAAAFTQPGTAAGTITWYANVRIYNTGF